MYYDICILSCLMKKPMYGYEIGKILKETFSSCTRISNNTIYPILKKFQKLGYITKKQQTQEGRPDKFVYEITESGRKGFIQGLNSVTGSLASNRDEFFVRLSFFHLMTPDVRKKMLEDRMAFIRESLDNVKIREDGEGIYSQRSKEGKVFLLSLYSLETETIEKFQLRIDEPCLAPKEYL
ncbi:PadR family transcriptional regulator [Novisyntrophococcus fermenticellae]|uniref:PadR family transcriptional regulator n=1 Tax=Novisyntrophococcus fermenticellae TaxID=2068655 RepID=UPI001E2C93A2|nr:PadR family transcriptional regulator [Novisyntrophococcus fermenticellae]